MGDPTGIERCKAKAESSSNIPRPPFLLSPPLSRNELRADGPALFQELFRARVRDDPHAAAVVETDTHAQLTYRELDGRSDKLADLLRRHGARAESRIGLLLERSTDLLVALLGVWKAGATYVPLDPTYPAERLGQMIADAGLELLVTHREILPPRSVRQARILDLDLERAAFDGGDGGSPEASTGWPPDPRQAAYVIFTSGTAGRPKGVAVEHRSLAWYVTTLGRRYAVSARDRVLQFSSISFDVSLAEICLALAHGATLVLRGRRTADSAERFLRACREASVSVLMPPTAFWHELAAAVAKRPEMLPPSLRLVVFGGEAVIPERVRQWLENVGRRVRLINAYGPTEAAIEAALHEFVEPRVTASIGRPARGVDAFVLDRSGSAPRAGAAGELCLAGPGLARGYLGRPAETASRFVPHPFSFRAGLRLYRTGDLAKLGHLGQLTLAGRIDHQVKIRGYRVEPEEIEARIAEHPEVGEAVVVAKEELPGHRYLAAYVVLESSATASERRTEELRRFLRERLPAFMMPAAWSYLPALPRSPNGKIDRSALSSGARLSFALGRPTYAAPRTPIERTLARIWSEVLHLAEIGVHDNIFELGGDSILNLQIVSRATEEGLRLRPEDLFHHQTIAELATAAILAADHSSGGLAAQGRVTGEAPLAPVQRWFFEQRLPDPSHFNLALLLEVRRPLERRALEGAVRLWIEHHDALRLRFRREGGSWVQAHAADALGTAPLAWIDLSRCRRLALPMVVRPVIQRLQESLDIAAGPLLRVAYFDRGPLPGRLFVALHHLVADEVSCRILVEDLETSYLRLEEGRLPLLPAKTTSFKDWCEGLSVHAASDCVRRELDYWLELPRDLPEIPIDDAGADAGAANVRSSTRRVTAELDAHETDLLLRQVPAAYRTQIGDVLLSALVATWERWTGEPRLLVDVEGHGREAREAVNVSRTVGWFACGHPVYLEADAGAGPGEVLQTVKESLRAVPQQGMGFFLLRYLAPDAAVRARLSALREAQVSVNYLGQLDPQYARSTLFSPADEPTGAADCPGGRRPHLLQIDGFVVADRLWINWYYSSHLHRRTTIERLAVTFMEELRRLIAHCLEPNAGGFTAADFPLAGLSSAELRQWVGNDRSIEDVYPLAPVQEGILFHALYAPESQVYFEQNAWSLEGKLDAAAFRLAWERLVERHAILRTSFVWQGLSAPLQVVRRRAALPWLELDWRQVEPAEREERFAALLADDRRRGFAFSVAPLMRCALVDMGGGHHRFVWSVHHLLLDGWSTSLLLDELFELYDAIHHGLDARRRLPRPFRDYIGWLGRQDKAAARRFWGGVLNGFVGPTPLPMEPGDKTGEACGSDAYEIAVLENVSLRREVGLETTARLRALGSRRRLTLNTLIQGAWSLVLARSSGERDVVFGTTIAGRPQTLPGADEMVGLMINTLPVRVEVDPRRSVAPWLQVLQEANLEYRRHGYASLVEIQAWADLAHDRQLFLSSLGFQNFPGEAAVRERHGQLEIAELHYFSQTSDPLTILVSPDERLRLEASYAPSRFSGVTVLRLLGHLRTVLAAVAAGDDRKALGSLPHLTAAERHQLLREWNDTRDGSPAEPTFHALFARRAERCPDTPALRSIGRTETVLTYRGLDLRARALARELPALAPGAVVGLCLDRSPAMVAAMLAVLRAGAAFLFLDPAYPRKRLAFMVTDASLSLLVTQPEHRHLFEEIHVPRALVPGPQTMARPGASPGALSRFESASFERRRERHPEGRPFARTPAASPESLAYVVYTSGSTGRPKGVMLHHRGLVNLALDRHMGTGPGDVVLQFASPSFDGSVHEIAITLAAGATLDFAAPGPAPLGRHLTRLLAARRVTRAALPAAVVRGLPEAGGLPELRTLLSAGEACPPRAARTWSRHGRRFLNGYGPTETTVCATIGRMPRRGGAAPPIGRPIRNVEVHVLDPGLGPMAAGIRGEVFIGGAGVGRGYLERPATTAERFLPDPLGEAPGRRLYRSGDLARRLEDGQLDFLGRVDLQVKVRGFRVEPGEIASVLVRDPAVRQAVVEARLETSAAAGEGGSRLTAYVVPDMPVLRAGAGPEARAWEREQLAHWETIHEDVFDRAFPDRRWRGDAASPHAVGWMSSYTNRPIPTAEMDEWLDHTVARVLALAPRRVLEIGCGAGALVFRIAPRVERYLATDFSPAAIEVLRSRLAGSPVDDGRVELSVRRAEDFEGFAAGAFDTVVLSSVTQYFPSVEYLVEVLRAAIRATAPGGSIFLGDVRSAPLHEAFCASVELYRAGDCLPLARLRQRIRRRRRHEEELLVDPALFTALSRDLPEIRTVRVRPKLGRTANELTRFRYDVTLGLGGPAAEGTAAPVAPRRLDWRDGGLTGDGLRRLLDEERPPAAVVSGIPNRRLATALRALRLLAGGDGFATAGELRAACRDDGGGDEGLEPEDALALARGLPYDADLSWTAGGADGALTAVYRRHDVPEDRAESCWQAGRDQPRRPYPEYGNQPLSDRLHRQLVARLKARLGERLPPFMMPASFIVLDELPLTPGGKLDRRALPDDGDGARPFVESRFRAPESFTETALAEIWSDVLGVGEIGVDDNFFELGGHSLLATQMVSRIRQRLEIELPLSRIFERPTVARLATGLEEEAAPAAPRELPPIGRTPRPAAERGLALSFAQERLWFLDQLVPESPAYNMDDAWLLEGRLDPVALGAALGAIVARHEVLSTTYRAEDGEPRQVIGAAPPVALPAVDLTRIAEPRRREELRRLADEEANRPFDLAAGPLLRAVLVRLKGRDHDGMSVLLRTVHHIASDGWSERIFYRELGRFYEAAAKRRPAELPALPIQYADFAVWQRRWLESRPEEDGEDSPLELQLAYWRARLADLPRFDFPADRPRPPVQNYRGGVVAMRLGAAATDALKKLAQRRRASLYMALAAGMSALASRYTGETDVVLGTPVAGRRQRESEDLIGFFVNNLVLRLDLTGDPSFIEILGRTRSTALAAFAHQDLPFHRLVVEMRPDRELARSPFFQIVFAVHSAPPEAFETAGLSLRALDKTPRSPHEEPLLASERVAVDLEVHLVETPAGVAGYAVYNVDLFDATRLRRFTGHFERLLEGAAARPERRLAELDLLRHAERHQLLEEWNDTRAPALGRRPFHRLVAERAASRPDAPALRAVQAGGELELAYGELDARANRLAHFLLDLPELAAPGNGRVALILDCSPDRVVALLATAKAGAAFVALDPDLPRVRLAAMLAAADAPVILTREELLDRLLGVDARVVCLDRLELEIHSSKDPEIDVDLDEAAYVIFTSGSTGEPKGILLPHRGLANLVEDAHLGTRPGDVVLQLAPPGFDVSVAEVAMTLGAGAALDLGAAGPTPLGEALADLLEERGVSQVMMPAAAAKTLPAAAAARLPRLGTLLVGGEACPAELPRTWARHGRRVLNAYGPTETSVCVTVAPCPPRGGAPPIGRPLANVRCHVLDRRTVPVAAGVAGELAVAGAPLARGYLGRPRETAERFVPDPFAGPGGRMYLTGDLVRHLHDGRLVHLGRLDGQVKLRGVRIELGEVEEVLRRQPAVRDAAVTLAEDDGADPRLVAYVVPETEGSRFAEAARREHVEARRAVSDELYRQAGAGADFDTAGWTSSFTGRPIPEQEMREWVETTVERLHLLTGSAPPRVLEIGCGTGLLLFRLAPWCASYLGTDLSAVTVERLRGELTGAPRRFGRVRLECRSADDFRDLEPGGFDLVILSSVVQYFPDARYLARVIEGAVRLAAPGGVVFVGDVRSLALHETLAAAVELARAAPETPVTELRRRIAARRDREEELLLDPGFFTALAERLPRPVRVRVEPRAGRARNELNGFRYDVTLELDPAPGGSGSRGAGSACQGAVSDRAGVRRSLTYGENGGDWTIEGVARELRRSDEGLALRRVPDARLAGHVAARELVASVHAPATAAEILCALDPEAAGLEAADLVALGRRAARAVEWAAEGFGDGGRWDVIFHPRGETAAGRIREPPAGEAAGPARPLAAFANDPLAGRLSSRLVPHLRSRLEERLPAYMIPAAFVLLNELPLTANGKLDRRRLPAPGRRRPDLGSAATAPRSATEAKLLAIWSEVLGLEGIGVEDNFFELGGHSLLATQVVSRIRRDLGSAVALRRLFESPTIAELAATISEREHRPTDTRFSEEDFEEIIL